MRNFLLILPLTLITIAGWGKQSPLNLIHVTGICHKKVDPDRLRLVYTAEVTHKNREKSSRQANQLYSQVLKKIKKLNPKDLETHTDSYSVHPQHEWRSSKKIFKGYQTRITLSITTSDKKMAGALIEAGNQIGIQKMSGPHNFISPKKWQKTYLECLKVASGDAIQKADLLASELGVKRGKLHSASEQRGTSQPPAPQPRREMKMMAMAAGSSSAPEIQFAKTDLHIQLYTQFLVD